MTREGGGYVLDPARAEGLYELHAGRGLAGYGLARALRLLLDVLHGLSALHDTEFSERRPFVHAELVPGAIRVDASGVARLIPLAPWHWSAPGKLASPDRTGHLAPERLLGDAVDQRADVFSAGVLLWEALAGRRLFEADSSDEIIMRLLGGRVNLPALPPELTWAMPLKEVVMCALSVDPERRFGNAADLAEAIEAAVSEHVATHAEVAAFFGARDPHARPSVIAPVAQAATHNSSLSALVSPVSPSPSDAAEAPEPQRPSHDSSALPARGKGRLWAGAALLSLVVGGASALVTRAALRAPPEVATGTAASATDEAALAPPLIVPAAPSPSAAAALAASAPVIASSMSAAPSSAPENARSKLSKPGKGSHGVPPKARPPKFVRDKEAEKYGI